MAGLMVGGAFLGSFLNVLFDRLATSEFLEFFKTQKVEEVLLKELEISLRTVSAFLDDAEDRQLASPNSKVQKFIDDVKDAAFDAEDMLDLISYHVIAAKIEGSSTAATPEKQPWYNSPLHGLFSKASVNDDAKEAIFSRDLSERLKKIVDRLHSLEDHIRTLDLKSTTGKKEAWRQRETTSLVRESDVFGRDDELNEILELLQMEENDIGVIPIVGMGGVGKTTLAQLAYNHSKDGKLFESTAWVCVSDYYDVLRIKRELLKQVDNSFSRSDDLSAEEIDVKLMESLKGKKYLFVFDDVWNTDYDNWDKLRQPLKSGGAGSKIIVTTRLEHTASIMATDDDTCKKLSQLSDDNCWQLFAKHAFRNGEGNQSLQQFREDIVRKCGGLPLAAKMLGGVMLGKRTVAEWESILKSDVWQSLDNKVLPTLRLSYQHLPSCLKQCFAYLAIFPKDYRMSKEDIIQLWKAEGFLEQSEDGRMENIGEEYLQELVSRSFLQEHCDPYDGSYYLMHDLINDLAQHISGDLVVRVDGDNSCEFKPRNRYFSVMIREDDSPEVLGNIGKARLLRTFLLLSFGNEKLNEIVDEKMNELHCIRVLSLSNFYIMEKLPESIGDLKHLRYLNLARTMVERLPDTVCSLYNLQILILFNCQKLVELPKKLGNLINLHVLDVRRTESLREMPPGLGNLKDLRTLCKFYVGNQTGADINELGKLQRLRGKLTISNLENIVVRPNDILKNKEHLKELELVWDSENIDDTVHEYNVMEGLQPHTSVEKLFISGYRGTKFPNWIGDASYSKIVSLELHGSKNCFILPPFEQLSSLEHLSISKFDAVVEVWMKRPLNSLKTLRIEDLEEWEEWSFGQQNDPFMCGFLPKLEELAIINCPKLGSISRRGPISMIFESLNSLVIADCSSSFKISHLLATINCKQLVVESKPLGYMFWKFENYVELKRLRSGMHWLCVKNISMEGLEEIGSAINWLEEVEMRDNERCECIPLEVFPVLRSFEVEGFKNLKSLSAGDGLVGHLLTSLKISSCEDKVMVGLLKWGLNRLGALRNLGLCGYNGNDLESFLLPSSLTYLLISFFENVKYIKCKGLHHLVELNIENCPNLKGVGEEEGLGRWESDERKGELQTQSSSPPFHYNLQSLRIMRCDELIGGRRQWGLTKFNALSHLSLVRYFRDDLESFPEEWLLPSTLTSLTIHGFERLKKINSKGLQHLSSLAQLEISWCTNLQCFKDALPSSLSFLRIAGCPLMEERCEREKGEDWPNISHISTIEIDSDSD